MASRSARRRRRAAADVARVKQTQAAEPTAVEDLTRERVAQLFDVPEAYLAPAVHLRDPDDPPIFAALLGAFGGIADPPGTVWATPLDLSRAGLARLFRQLWPGELEPDFDHPITSDVSEDVYVYAS